MVLKYRLPEDFGNKFKKYMVENEENIQEEKLIPWLNSMYYSNNRNIEEFCNNTIPPNTMIEIMNFLKGKL